LNIHFNCQRKFLTFISFDYIKNHKDVSEVYIQDVFKLADIASADLRCSDVWHGRLFLDDGSIPHQLRDLAASVVTNMAEELAGASQELAEAGAVKEFQVVSDMVDGSVSAAGDESTAPELTTTLRQEIFALTDSPLTAKLYAAYVRDDVLTDKAEEVRACLLRIPALAGGTLPGVLSNPPCSRSQTAMSTLATLTVIQAICRPPSRDSSKVKTLALLQDRFDPIVVGPSANVKGHIHASTEKKVVYVPPPVLRALAQALADEKKTTATAAAKKKDRVDLGLKNT
jgi:hypothetical protein